MSIFCERIAMDQIKSQFSQFLTSNGLKGYDGLIKIVILPQFSMSNVHFAQKGYDALTIVNCNFTAIFGVQCPFRAKGLHFVALRRHRPPPYER